MSSTPFDLKQFGIRYLVAFVLVIVTYNATGYSLSHWLVAIFPKIVPGFGVCALICAIGWAIFLRATLRSLGPIGLLLLISLLAMFLWLFWDLGWLSLTNSTLLSWLVNFGLALVLAIGISWSHIRRRISGQIDVDNIDN